MRSRSRNERSYFGLAVIGATVIFVSAQMRAQQPAQSTQSAEKPHPIIEPMRWLIDGHKFIQKIPDYTCVLEKRERINGRLHQPHLIAFRFRREPFSVNMRWIHPKDEVVEVSYIHGWNNNKMRVKARGGPLKRLAGFVSVAVNDRRVTSRSRHLITDAGLENLIVKLFRSYEVDYKLKKTDVKIDRNYEYANKPCYRIETIRKERNPQFYCYRTVVYLDKETKLPVLCQNYDWPFAGGPAGGLLIESYSVTRFQFNVGLDNSAFRR